VSGPARRTRAFGHLAVGFVLVGAGLLVTWASKETVWYGAVVVGAIEILRGARRLLATRRE
jgi:uncharacterized protein (DUF983 family)